MDDQGINHMFHVRITHVSCLDDTQPSTFSSHPIWSRSKRVMLSTSATESLISSAAGVVISARSDLEYLAKRNTPALWQPTGMRYISLLSSKVDLWRYAWGYLEVKDKGKFTKGMGFLQGFPQTPTTISWAKGQNEWHKSAGRVSHWRVVLARIFESLRDILTFNVFFVNFPSRKFWRKNVFPHIRRAIV